MSLGRYGGTLYGKILGSELIIWGGSELGNNNDLSIGWYGGTLEFKRPGGAFGRWLVSKIGTEDGIWLGARVDWTVRNSEGLVGVLVGLSLRKYVESLLGIIVESGKGSVEDKIVGLVRGDKMGHTEKIFGFEWCCQSLERACNNTWVKRDIQWSWDLGHRNQGRRWGITRYFIVTSFRK